MGNLFPVRSHCSFLCSHRAFFFFFFSTEDRQSKTSKLPGQENNMREQRRIPSPITSSLHWGPSEARNGIVCTERGKKRETRPSNETN